MPRSGPGATWPCRHQDHSEHATSPLPRQREAASTLAHAMHKARGQVVSDLWGQNGGDSLLGERARNSSIVTGTPSLWAKRVVGDRGLEPLTFCV